MMSDEEYEVEKILDKKSEQDWHHRVPRQVEVLRGPRGERLGARGQSRRRWESNLGVRKGAGDQDHVATQPTKQQKIDLKEKAKEGFVRGLQAEKIIGIRKDPEKLFFLVKWKGTEDKDFVDANEAKIKIPQVVIDFFEEKLNWFNDPEDSQDEEE